MEFCQIELHLFDLFLMFWYNVAVGRPPCGVTVDINMCLWCLKWAQEKSILDLGAIHWHCVRLISPRTKECVD